MTHEQFIGIETAKLAKQAGYRWDGVTYAWYKGNLIPFSLLPKGNKFNLNDYYAAPTQSVLQRWLRELHNLIIVVKPYYGKEVVYGYIIYQEAEGCIKRIEDGIVDRSYESTLEVAEQKCLTLLIEKQ